MLIQRWSIGKGGGGEGCGGCLLRDGLRKGGCLLWSVRKGWERDAFERCSREGRGLERGGAYHRG